MLDRDTNAPIGLDRSALFSLLESAFSAAPTAELLLDRNGHILAANALGRAEFDPDDQRLGPAPPLAPAVLVTAAGELLGASRAEHCIECPSVPRRPPASADPAFHASMARIPTGDGEAYAWCSLRPLADGPASDSKAQAPTPSRAREPARHPRVEAERLSTRALEAVSDGIVIVDARRPDQPITWVNSAFERISGYAAEEVLGHNCRFLQGDDTDPEELGRLRAAVAAHQEVEVVLRNYRRDGAAFWNALRVAPVHDEGGRLTHFVGAMTDITRQRDFEQALAYRDEHDPLTELHNRQALDSSLAAATRQGLATGHGLALLFIDIDQLRMVNEAAGHRAGDSLLNTVARRLQTCCSPDDLVGRLGGDEFILASNDAGTRAAASARAEALIEAISPPVLIRGYEITPGVSIGIALAPEHGDTSDMLLRHADLAMSEAKAAGRRTWAVYDASMGNHLDDRLTMDREMRTALERDRFELYYQPQIDLANERIVGMEALLRWRRRDGRMISPTRFIPAAEANGFIGPLGEWVLRRACEQNVAWQRAGYGPFPVAVNVSPIQFRRASLIDQIERILTETGLEARYLEIEITENMTAEGTIGVIDTLRALKKLGVRIAIDDFGTGYSSMGFLKHFPLDVLKVDRSFVHHVDRDPSDGAICRSILELAHNLSLQAIAEGVERPEELEYLRSIGCDSAQGYLLGRPAPARTLTSTLPCPPPDRGAAPD